MVNDKTLWLLDRQFAPQAFTPLEQDLIAICMNFGGVLTDIQPTSIEHKFIDGYLYTRTDANKGDLSSEPYIHSVDVTPDANAWQNKYLPEIQSNLNRMRQVIFKDSSLTELSQHFTYLMEIYRRHWELHEQLRFPLLRSYWIKQYEELHGQKYDVETELLLTGTSNLTKDLLSGMIDLAQFIQTPGDIRSAIRSHPPEEALALLTTTKDGFEFLKRLLDFIADFGLRTGHGFGSPFSWRTPTWLEEPAQLLAFLHPYLDVDLTRLAESANTLRKKRENLEQEITATINNANDKNRFLTSLAVARENVINSENHNFFIEQMTNGYIRICLTESADRLVDEKVFSNQDDIFFLNLEQVMAVISGSTVPDLTGMIRARRIEHENYSEIKPPTTLETSSANIEHDRSPLPSKDLLGGVGASEGIVTGRARIIDSLQPIPMIDSEDIIVTQNAGPMWIPLFPSIKGLVLDYGSIASHAAIITREYQIPCVIQTYEGTSLIRDGQKLTVDGTNGIIRLEK